jgi:hypothetical protein
MPVFYPGLSFALLLFMLMSQTLLKILHYCPISPHCTIACTIASSLARQPFRKVTILKDPDGVGRQNYKLFLLFPKAGNLFPAINKILRF